VAVGEHFTPEKCRVCRDLLSVRDDMSGWAWQVPGRLLVAARLGQDRERIWVVQGGHFIVSATFGADLDTDQLGLSFQTTSPEACGITPVADRSVRLWGLSHWSLVRDERLSATSVGKLQEHGGVRGR